MATADSTRQSTVPDEYGSRRQKPRLSRAMPAITLLLGVVFITGCSSVYGTYGYGKLALAKRLDGKPAIEVELPENAPSISQRYRPTAVADAHGGHNGIDLLIPVGTPVLAAASGVVRTVQLSILYGNQVFLDHGEDAQGRTIQTRYFHLDESLVEENQRILRGQKIAVSGLSGVYALFPHLHFEVRELTDSGELKSHRPLDPQLHWVDGVGKITCYDKRRDWPSGSVYLTYPAPCGGVPWR